MHFPQTNVKGKRQLHSQEVSIELSMMGNVPLIYLVRTALLSIRLFDTIYSTVSKRPCKNVKLKETKITYFQTVVLIKRRMLFNVFN